SCLAEVSATFHGRDVFAPIAAHLSLGLPLEELGPRVESVVKFVIVQPVVEGRRARGQVVYFDRFGNAITNLPRGLVASAAQSEVRIVVGGHTVWGLAHCYEEGAEKTPIALWGSSGYLEIAVRRASARDLLGLTRGQEVVIEWRGA
ncbi:MAG: SAM-dependent chlorinase/fluorinase, partial [Calditrichaeota bacterium]|nr:SAM-dependent chlorinase/fluorinase [Calditrichota bacterium]